MPLITESMHLTAAQHSAIEEGGWLNLNAATD